MLRAARRPHRLHPSTTLGAWVASLAIAAPSAWIAGPASAAGEPVVEKLQHGEVNWTDKVIIASGSGAPDLKLPNVAAIRLAAERAAEMTAQRNVLEALKGVRLRETVLGDKVTTTAQTSGALRGCKRVDTRYFSDYGVDVVLRCPLDGVLATIVAPPADFKATEATGEKLYSGLVIDATGLGHKPALYPRVLDADGGELYGQSTVKPAFLQKSGAVAYYGSVDAAKKAQDRVGAAPLVVVASAVSSNDIKLSKDDVAKLRAAHLGFLAEGRVAVVVSP